jgi:hypothetical protein
MKKQTAVEWLEEQINPDMKTMQGNIIQDLLERAKAMEREQIAFAHVMGLITNLEIEATEQAKDYYNRTYKGGEQ